MLVGSWICADYPLCSSQRRERWYRASIQTVDATIIDTLGNLPKRIPTLGIIYNPNCFDKYLEGWISSCRFKLVVLNKVLDEQSERISLNNTVPTLNEFKQAEIDELRTTRPVEELFNLVLYFLLF